MPVYACLCVSARKASGICLPNLSKRLYLRLEYVNENETPFVQDYSTFDLSSYRVSPAITGETAPGK